MNRLFRQEALDKISDPDQLDQTLQLVQPRHVLGVGVGILVIVGGLVWSILSTAPEKVNGHGVLLSPAGVANVTTPGTGRIERLLVSPGQHVKQGQAVAEISRPELRDELEAARTEAEEAHHQLQAMAETFAVQEALQSDLQKEMRAALETRVASLQEQRQTLIKRREGGVALRRKGFISEFKLYETETQLAEVANELAKVRNRITELAVEHARQKGDRQQQLAQAELLVNNLVRKAEKLEHKYNRKRVAVAPSDGRVVEISVDPSDPVEQGQPIMRLLSSDGAGDTTLSAVVFVPDTEGKRVRPGMAAQVAPSTVKVEKDGFILGQVVRVAELPSSRESMLRRLKNALLVDKILEDGPPFEVEIKLARDPSTPSGYAWSSGMGPGISVEVGTVAETGVVVDRTPILSLVFPAFDHVIGWYRSL